MGSIERLKHGKEFEYVYQNGSKFHTSGFVLFYTPSREGRVGFTISKKVGNAIKRNFARRRLRMLYRLHVPHLKKGIVVIVAKAPVVEMKFKLLERDFLYALKKLKIDLHAQEGCSIVDRV